MKKDTLYSKEQDRILPFKFNKAVVDVFDDMLCRSVPMYKETVYRQAQLTAMHYQKGSRIYDLGCSHGNLGVCLIKEMGEQKFEMIAVDNSMPMLDAYRKRALCSPGKGNIQFICENIQDTIIENASVVIINLTLQFLSIDLRDTLIKKVFDALLPEGILMMTEKVVHQDQGLDALQQEFHHRFKKENGYSDLEISQKRDALENVLVCETIEGHLKRLETAGFEKTDIWQKWFNFAAFIGRK